MIEGQITPYSSYYEDFIPPSVLCHECSSEFYPGETIYRKGRALLCIDCIVEEFNSLKSCEKARTLGYTSARITCKKAVPNGFEDDSEVYII